MSAKAQRLNRLAKLAELAELAQFCEEQEENELLFRAPKRTWVRIWISRRSKEIPLYRELKGEDVDKFYADFRFMPEDFEILLNRIAPRITKKDTLMRQAIPACIRLQVTLRYLASGANFGVLEDIFRVPKSTLSTMIPDVCQALWEELSQECIVTPQTSSEWKKKAKEWGDRWQYPFGLSALDGKHIEVQAFANSGTLCYNYKGYFSFVLLAAVDANYQFIFADIGAPGSQNDATIWEQSDLKQAIDSWCLNLPDGTDNVQYHILGDDIFPLSVRLMKPFSRNKQLTVAQKIFNYRFSRARRVVENTFGQMCSKFRVLRTPILQNYGNAVLTAKAVILLHNYSIQNCNQTNIYMDLLGDDKDNLTPTLWETEALSNIAPMDPLAGNASGTRHAREQRDFLAHTMIVDGLAPWQFKYTFRTN